MGGCTEVEYASVILTIYEQHLYRTVWLEEGTESLRNLFKSLILILES